MDQPTRASRKIRRQRRVQAERHGKRIPLERELVSNERWKKTADYQQWLKDISRREIVSRKMEKDRCGEAQ